MLDLRAPCDLPPGREGRDDGDVPAMQPRAIRQGVVGREVVAAMICWVLLGIVGVGVLLIVVVVARAFLRSGEHR